MICLFCLVFHSGFWSVFLVSFIFFYINFLFKMLLWLQTLFLIFFKSNCCHTTICFIFVFICFFPPISFCFIFRIWESENWWANASSSCHDVDYAIHLFDCSINTFDILSSIAMRKTSFSNWKKIFLTIACTVIQSSNFLELTHLLKLELPLWPYGLSSF